jgi:uncharacterized protein YkwD
LIAVAALVALGPASEAGPRAKRMNRLIASQRRAWGVRRLRHSHALHRCARRCARDLRRDGVLHHCGCGRAEMVGVGPTVRSVFRAYLQSSAHRAIMASNSWHRMASACIRTPAIVWTVTAFRCRRPCSPRDGTP